MNNPEFQGLRTYMIRILNSGIENKSIRTKVEGYVRTGLSLKGFHEASKEEDADMIVEVDYGVINSLAEAEIRSVEVTTEVGREPRFVQVYRGEEPPESVPIYDSPEIRTLRTEERVVEVTKYIKLLRMKARVNKPEDPEYNVVHVWDVSVTTEDESDKIRRYLPFLTAACIHYLGKSTEKPEKIKLRSRDRFVSLIKAGAR